MAKVIGVTGGIGCGKSKLISMLSKSCSCLVVDTDSVAKRLMSKGGISYKLIVESFGSGILKDDGEINRKALAALVMGDDEKLEVLNRLTHPCVIKEVRRIIKEDAEEFDVVAVESALLMDTALKDMCDEVWNVSARMATRLDRLCRLRGYTQEEAERFMKSQRPEQWYVQHADLTLVNDDEGGEGMRKPMEVALQTLLANR